jgi:hypothetical protein
VGWWKEERGLSWRKEKKGEKELVLYAKGCK